MNNRLSRRNAGSPEIGGRLRALLGDDGEVLEASTPGELARAVERFRSLEIDLLCIGGGDGTAHLVLTAFARAYGDAPLPAVALLRAGSMNTVADAHHLHGTPESILRAIVAGRRGGTPPRTVERDLLSVSRADEEPCYGFLFGTGAVVAFLDAYYRRRPTPARAAALIVRAVTSAMSGGKLGAALSARETLAVASDGEDWPEEGYLAVLAGVVPEIGFGFKPFARCDEQPGFFHAVGITGSVLHVAAHLPRIWLGQPWSRSLATDAVVRDLSIEGAARFMVDGEIYRSGDRVRVRTGPSVRLVVV